MRTRLGIFSKAASEAAFLVACVTVPVFFNFYSRRLFEPDKGAWLRTLILCGLVFWGVGALESRGESRRVKGRKRPEAEDSALVEQQTLPLLRNPLIWSIIAYLLAYLIATVFSIQPVLSWWGSYDRAEGFMAILGYGGAFGLGLAVLSRPGAIGRFWRGVCLTGIAVAFYAVLQRLGLDAGLWDIQEPTVRVFGTFGNPIFLGSYLLLVFPLTLLGSLGYPFPGESRRPDKRGRLLYGTGAALQAIGLILTLSRGPFLGLITEIGIILILWAVLQDRKRLLAGVLAAVIVIAGVLLVASQPDAPLKFARDLPYAGRLVGSLDATSRTSQTRLLTWGAILKLLDREPARWLVGYGSDTLILTFGQVFPEALVSLSNTVGTLYDRAHNVILDALYTGGLLGALATLGIYACAFAAGLRYVWPAARRFQYMLLWILMAGLSLAGGGIALLAPGLNPYFGILAGLGLLAGVILWLIWHPWMETREPNAAAESDIAEKLGREQDRAKINWPMIVLIAAIAGHLVEMQFGIAIVATSFLFWIELAVLVILPQSVWGKDTYSQPAESGNGGFSWMFWGMVTAILMITFIFDFVTPEISLRNAGVPIALLLFFTWVSGLMLYSAEEKSTERIKFVILSLTLTGLYFILHLLLVAEKRGEWLWWGYQGVLVLLLLVWAGGGAATSFERVGNGQKRGWRYLVYLGGGIVAIIFSLWMNQRPVLADMYFRSGLIYLQAHDWLRGNAAFQQALDLAPYQDHYRRFQDEASIEAARSLPPSQKDDLMDEAEAALQKGIADNPLNAAGLARLGYHFRIRAAWAGTPASRQYYLDLAMRMYEKAVILGPRNVPILVEAAELYVDRSDVGRAAALAQEALRLQPRYAPAYALWGDIYLLRGDLVNAEAAYRQALTIDPTQTLQERLRTVQENSTDSQRRLELAVIYKVLGRPAEALQEVRQAIGSMDNGPLPIAQQILTSLQP